MAKGNMLLGYARGKVGDLVFTRRNGEQITRPRVRVVNNPKTEGQMIQRMIFASVIWAYAKMKSICDHSFEGVKYGADSQAKFMSENLKRLRAYYPTSADPRLYAEINAADTKAFLLPSMEGKIGAGLLIANGTLPEISRKVGEDGALTGFGNPFTPSGVGGPTVGQIIDAVDAAPGDQITIVCITDAGEFLKSRYVINADVTQLQRNEVFKGDGTNTAFDQEKTKVNPAFYIDGQEGVVMPTAENGANCLGIILSRKDESGKWLRSPATLYPTGDEAADYQADYALPYWQFSGTDIATDDPHYLNNADI